MVVEDVWGVWVRVVERVVKVKGWRVDGVVGLYGGVGEGGYYFCVGVGSGCVVGVGVVLGVVVGCWGVVGEVGCVFVNGGYECVVDNCVVLVVFDVGDIIN